jgi:hypothetical protein
MMKTKKTVQFSTIMKWLVNPFERIAGWQALFIGLVVMALTAVIGKINHIAFDGVLDVHVGAMFSFPASFAMQAIDFLTLFLIMWIAGLCFSKSKLRAIDVAGTMALARAPMLLLAIVCFLPVIPASPYDIPLVIIFSLIIIPFYIWMIAMMYNAYSVSCHLKGGKAILSFIGALLVAEIVSKLIFIFLSGSLFANVPIRDTFKFDSTKNTVVVADSSLTIRQKTENVVKAFEKGNFDAITVYFDATMKKSLPSGGLKMAWMQNNLTYGKFEKADLGGLNETRIDPYDIIDVPFFFKKKILRLRLTFNKDREISGLFLLPVP